MYKINLISNILLSMGGREMYNLAELEEDMNLKAKSIFDKPTVTWNTIFILTEEEALYFKSKYDHFIGSIEEIEENDDE